MATSAHRSDEHPTYDNPSAFFDAMEFHHHNADHFAMHQHDPNSAFGPFKLTSKFNAHANADADVDAHAHANVNSHVHSHGPSHVHAHIDPALQDPLDSFVFNEDVSWRNSRFDPLEMGHATLSPLETRLEYDTGYSSQGTTPDKSPPAFAQQHLEMDNFTRPDHPQHSQQLSQQPGNNTQHDLQQSMSGISRKRSSSRGVGEERAASKPRKTRRTTKTASAKSPSEEEAGLDGARREQFLARNREAASKCRAKKKEWTSGLEERARELAQEKQMLTTYLAMLKNELLLLKCKCLEHSTCGCDTIRDYLKNTVSSLPPANASLYKTLNRSGEPGSDGAGASACLQDVAREVGRKQSLISVAMSGDSGFLGDRRDSATPVPNGHCFTNLVEGGPSASSNGSSKDLEEHDFLRLEQELTVAAGE